MTPDLKAMVEAMKIEIARQAREGDAMPYVAEGFEPNALQIDGDINLEAVARVGLEAIKRPGAAVLEAAADSTDRVEGTLGTASVIEAAIDAILKEQP